MTRIVCMSDIHETQRYIKAVPDGDILIVAGDMTFKGLPVPLEDFNRWLGTLPHRHKVVIAGNHELTFEKGSRYYVPNIQAVFTNAIYLEDSEVIIDGLKIYGSPWQPEFCNWAFNLPRGEPLASIWAAIPDDTDILVTHGPPMGILDRVQRGENVGCEELARRVFQVKPQLHVFGHIHSGYGEQMLHGIHFVNASTCNEQYRPVNPPIVVDLDEPRAKT